MAKILQRATGQYRVPYALLAGCGPLRAGEAHALRLRDSANTSRPTFEPCTSGRKPSEESSSVTPKKQNRVNARVNPVFCSRQRSLSGFPLATALREGLLFRTSTSRSTLAGEHATRQPTPDPSSARTREGRIQHLPPFPHHPPSEDLLPGSASAFLFWARAEPHSPNATRNFAKSVISSLEWAEKIGVGFELSHPGWATCTRRLIVADKKVGLKVVENVVDT